MKGAKKKKENSNQAKHTPTESAKTPYKGHEKKPIRQWYPGEATTTMKKAPGKMEAPEKKKEQEKRKGKGERAALLHQSSITNK